VAHAGLNPRQFQSGTSVNRPTRISRIGNAVLRSGPHMPAMAALRHSAAVAALAARLRALRRLRSRQILIAAMRKPLVICFGVPKSGRPFDAALAMPAA
jgi:transposase